MRRKHHSVSAMLARLLGAPSRALRRWYLESKVDDAEHRCAELDALARALPAQTEAAYARLTQARARYFGADVRPVYRAGFLAPVSDPMTGVLHVERFEQARRQTKERVADRRMAHALAIVGRGTRGELADVGRIGASLAGYEAAEQRAEPFQRPRVVKVEK